jgi:hypothetical protein
MDGTRKHSSHPIKGHSTGRDPDDRREGSPAPAQGDNTLKDPDDWKTGDEPMTGAQRSYLHTLAAEAHEEVDDDLTKAETAKRIDTLRKKTGRDQEAS